MVDFFYFFFFLDVDDSGNVELCQGQWYTFTVLPQQCVNSLLSLWTLPLES